MPEAVPVALVVVAVIQLASAPAANWVSRRMEAEADWKALQVTADPASLEDVMVGLAETSLGDPDPPGWVQLLLGTHPSLEDRIAMARAWAERNPQPGVVLVRAPLGKCWSLSVDDHSREGCGPASIDIQIERETDIAVRKREGGTWGLGLSLEIDGQVVRWAAPFTSDDGEITFHYDVVARD